mgnify:CR=1 FL=1
MRKSRPWQKRQRQKSLRLSQNYGSQGRNVSPEKLKQLLQNKRFLKSARAYNRERLVGRLRTVHPKTITRLAQNDTGNVADRHMKQILSIYNGAGRTHNLPCKR